MHFQSKLSKVNTWIAKEVKKIVQILQKKNKQKAILATGYSPSNTPHVGTYTEVIRSIMIRDALEKFTPYKGEILCFTDDLDAFRKIPEDMPQKDALQKYLGMPLIKVPDTHEEYSTLAERNKEIFRKFISNLNVENIKIIHSSQEYKNGSMNSVILEVAQKYEKIKNIITHSIGEERKKNYSPFLPICKKTGKILQCKVNFIDVEKCELTYENNKEKITTSFLNGQCKLQWKADWAARWKAFDVDYEMCGKDVIDSHYFAKKIGSVLGNVPTGMHYEMFTDESNKKLSKSKGNSSFTVEEWMKHSFPSTFFFFAAKNPYYPSKFTSNNFIICHNEYFQECNKYTLLKEESKMYSRLYYINDKFKKNIQVDFSLLYYMSKFIQNPSMLCEKSVCKGEFALEFSEKIINFTKKYFNKNAHFTLQEEEIKAIKHLKEILKISTKDELRSNIYECGKKFYLKNDLKKWFDLLYMVFFNSCNGPRIDTFIQGYSIEKSIQLIDKCLTEQKNKRK